MSDQRLLVAYPVGLLYGCFALLSVFNVGSGGVDDGRGGVRDDRSAGRINVLNPMK